MLALCLAACATPTVQRPEEVAVKANTVSPQYSSVNATVLNDASVLDYSFATSLDPRSENVTRLESSYTHDVAIVEQVRVGDTSGAPQVTVVLANVGP